MKRSTALKSLVLACALAGPARSAEFQQRWCYGTGNLSEQAGYDKVMKLLGDCKAAGITHLSLWDSSLTRLDLVPPLYFENAKKLQAAAKADGITLVPLVFPIGYSGTYMRYDPNLAAGVPARDVPFVARDGKLVPDAAAVPVLKNADFPTAGDARPAAWTAPEDVRQCFGVDRETHHGGGAALRLGDVGRLPPQYEGSTRVEQTLDVKPFQYYRVNVWIKTDGLKASGEDVVRVQSTDGMRRCTYQNVRLKPTQDWTLHQVTFNTFECTKVRLQLGVAEATAGTVWFDDVTIEPAGMLLVLRRPNKPLTVTSEDGKTVYEEGRDFAEIHDPQLAERPFKGEYTVNRELPAVTLTPDSRIKDGQKLNVSYFHHMRIYDAQDVISLQDPMTVELMDKQMAQVVKVWQTGHYFMKYDEIRVGGWETQPNSEHKTPGELLAANVRAGYDIIQKHAPGSTAYIFSDMFTPYHNARPMNLGKPDGKGYYYLSNGDYTGAWDGLDKNVVIANWYSPDDKTPRFFAERGHKQILCGYYDDKKMKNNVAAWMKATEGVPGVLGLMYTTWENNYRNLAEYMRLAAQYPNFDDGAAETKDALKDR